MTFPPGSSVRALKNLNCMPFPGFSGCHLAQAGDIGWSLGPNENGDPTILFPKTDRKTVIPQEDLELARDD